MTKPREEATAAHTLVVASNNKKKLRELNEILGALAPGFALRSAAEAGIGEIDETGTTFHDNALIKAMAAWRRTGLPSLADDSGLEVDALGGEPGVYSARYAGPGATDADNNAKVQAALVEVSDERRTARYRCVIALVVPRALAEAIGAEPVPDEPDAAFVLADGAVEGLVLREPRGAGGFGYDPYMLYAPAGLTFAELPADTKNAISHRGAALRAIAPHLVRLAAALAEEHR